MKETLRTVDDEVRAEPTSAVLERAVTKLTTPLGMLARWASSARAAAVSGVSPGDLATTVQPAARAGPILRVIIAAGKFHLCRLLAVEPFNLKLKLVEGIKR